MCVCVYKYPIVQACPCMRGKDTPALTCTCRVVGRSDAKGHGRLGPVVGIKSQMPILGLHCTHTHTHTHTHTPVMHMHACSHTMYTHKHTSTHTHTQVHTHTCTHTHTHAHTCTCQSMQNESCDRSMDKTIIFTHKTHTW